MFVYAIRDKKSGKIYSMKSSGGAFYSRKGDAKNKMANDPNLEIVEFLLNEVPNNTEIKGRKYLYKYSTCKLVSRKQRYWEQNEYKTFELMEI